MVQQMDPNLKVESSMVLKSLANEDLKMITGAVTSTANIVTSSISLIRLFTPI